MAKIPVKKLGRMMERWAYWLYVGMILMAAFDVATTFFGVCHLGGREQVASSTILIQTMGLIPFIVFFIGIYAFGGWWFLRAIRREKSVNFKVLWVTVMILSMVHYSNVMVNNAVAIFQIVTDQAPERVEDNYAVQQFNRDPEQVRAALELFDRSNFCRLWPGAVV